MSTYAANTAIRNTKSTILWLRYFGPNSSLYIVQKTVTVGVMSVASLHIEI